ncbi:hypothetical protein A2U01_0011643, partial [Trifolium medium]|nr:hypothetical protein [Trifolium medium]
QANRPCCSAWFATRTDLRCSALGRTSGKEASASVRCDSLRGSLQRTRLDSEWFATRTIIRYTNGSLLVRYDSLPVLQLRKLLPSFAATRWEARCSEQGLD